MDNQVKEFTPGPWVLEIEDEEFAWIWEKDRTKIIFSKPLNHSSALADCTLATAAPDLLEACKSALAQLEDTESILFEKLENAIKKATGVDNI